MRPSRGPTTRSRYLAILDIQLPHRSGLQFLQRLRAKGDATPVLILTARDRCADRVAGLDAGADDYMVKPFDLDELLARLRALVRRAEGRAGPVLGCNRLTLDPSSHQVTFEGEPVSLSRYEFSILHALLENAGRALSRERLEQILYGWVEDVESNTVEVYVHRLRKKLYPELIRTVRGVGYVLERHR